LGFLGVFIFESGTNGGLTYDRLTVTAMRNVGVLWR